MAPRKTKQPPGPSAAAPADVKNTSRRSRARPVGSQTQIKAAATQLDAVASGEEFDFQGIDDDDDAISDTSGPPNPPPKLEPQDSSSQPADTVIGPVKPHAALDVLHFFDGLGRIKDRSSKGEEPVPKICKICSEKYGLDKSTHPDGLPNFIYGSRTRNSNLRRHLRIRHAEEYDKAVVQYKWGYRLSNDTSEASKLDARNKRSLDIPSYSPAVFREYLVRFIVADDQSIRVVECPEFRQLCMILRENLADADIPRRGKVRVTVITQWRDWFGRLRLDLSKSCGRISFTSDVWSNANLASYLALTAHWISCDASSGRLALNTSLIGFHRLKKRHTGVNIAKTILYLIDRAGLTSKIGYFTLDNAENNAVAMQELEVMLADREMPNVVDFDHLKHRIRCYAHIINICSSHVISSVTSVKDKDGDDSEDELDGDDPNAENYVVDELKLDDCYRGNVGDDSTKLKRWFAGIKRNPLKRARKLIQLLRASDQRREGLRRFIQDGNARGWFFTKTETGDRVQIEVPELQLLRDVKTRWDSVYMMLQRLRYLRPAIDQFLSTELAEFSDWKLSESDWCILEGLETVLDIPHTFQQSMSSESTPILSRAISSFEMFMTQWEVLGNTHEELRPWTQIGLHWAKKYYSRMDDTDAYVITMFLNPALRFTWIQSEWGSDYIRLAKNTILALMRQYRKPNPSKPEATTTAPPLRRNVPELAPTRFKIQDSVYKNRSARETGSVEAEFQKYVSDSTTSEETSILRFWETNKAEFPTLFSIAMDYLPIQGTSVPCERVFSSAKDTDTAKRNRISPALMEALQMLKYSIKKERLNFMHGWSTSEAAMSKVSETTGDLGSLIVDDPDAGCAAFDKLLNGLGESDEC